MGMAFTTTKNRCIKTFDSEVGAPRDVDYHPELPPPSVNPQPVKKRSRTAQPAIASKDEQNLEDFEESMSSFSEEASVDDHPEEITDLPSIYAPEPNSQVLSQNLMHFFTHFLPKPAII